jgi:mono/diheme cytochrome c family protein
MRALVFVALLATGCRGWTSESPPVHLNPNMDTQEKLKAYRANDFFADGRAMRPIPEGTVARGHLDDDPHFFQGLSGGASATSLPAGFTADEATLRRGRERYDIYCAPCHDRAGDGQGTVAARLGVKPPTFHDARVKDLPIGGIFQAITKGVNAPNMPSYAVQIDARDRWAIAAYVRVLQKARDPSYVPSR